jgi:Fe-S oxidoreductase
MNSMNFAEFRNTVSTRKKFQQILNAFADTIDNPDIPKYICAPCSNCKGAIRDILEYYDATEKYNLQYDGLVELMVNALASMDRPYLEFLIEEEE